ncbi:MAG: penicillin-binding protein [Blastocatellia bacterium]|nr:MAG: penicillin-binding protein [Blastocatellia bacterium]
MPAICDSSGNRSSPLPCFLLPGGRFVVPKRDEAEIARWGVFSLLVLISAASGALVGLALVYTVDLPQVRDLEHYRPIANTELFDDQGQIIGSFARQRRVIAQYEDYPSVLYNAVIAIEDRDFERHTGVTIWRILGAAYRDVVSGANVQGASTLTMQLARNLFLSRDRTYRRKVQEILLAIQIERHFSKEQIFTLYANQIYLGHGIYGFETGAEYYFNKRARELTLEEAALLASLPKAPNNYSPIRNPEAALRRRNIVINAMLEIGKVSAAQAQVAKERPLVLHVQPDPNSLAPYFVETVRQYLEKKYGSEIVYENGLKVYTTLNMDLQRAANRAVLNGLAAYERRHGWHVQLSNVRGMGATVKSFNHPDWQTITPGAYLHAVVSSVSSSTASLNLGPYKTSLGAGEVLWTQRSLSQLPSVGDIVYVRVLTLGPGFQARVSLEEDSGVQGALVAIDNVTGEIKAMVGGRDFKASKFNRATQAFRQAGSSFKPYVYTAAIDQGAMPEDTVVDAPITFMKASGPYTPHNYDEKFEGTITLRRALAESRNIPALKVARQVGLTQVIDYVRRFGISAQIPPYLPIALGAVDLTLLDNTSAYSAFPNDGIRLVPTYLRKVTDYDGSILEEKYPEGEEVVSERTARIMTSMLREVVTHGTAAAASHMKYSLAGKTGTTNDFTDAWFVGFSPSITCGVWVGFDEKKSLGKRETGARTALPIWMEFMKAALGGRDRLAFPAPVPEVPTRVDNQQIETELSSLPALRYEIKGVLPATLVDSTKQQGGAPAEKALNVSNR